MANHNLFTVNAFTKNGSGGNPAGVVWLEDTPFPSAGEMQGLAAELAYSETAFIRKSGSDNPFETRYFTPVAEVDLCGHATIGAFNILMPEGVVADGGVYSNITKAGTLSIEIVGGMVFMEAGEPMEIATISGKGQLRELHTVMGIDTKDKNPAAIVSTGLPDILMPVSDLETLMAISPNFDDLSDLSEDYDVVGVHAFAASPDINGWHVRNFAPLYGINEECATGTSNAALAYHLYKTGKVTCDETIHFIQGESMNRVSEILGRVEDNEGNVRVWVGGDAAIVTRSTS